MTDEQDPGESRRDIAANSLRALRAARGNVEQPAAEAAAEPEVLDDPSELTDDPAVQPATAAEPDTTEPDTTEPDAADPETLDDPSELTDDPAVQPITDTTEQADTTDEADTNNEADTNDEANTTDEADIEAVIEAVIEAEAEAPVDDESGAEAQADAEQAAVEEQAVATSADDEPPALAASTPRSHRRGKVALPKTPAASDVPPAPKTARRRVRPLTLVASVAAVLALVFALVSGIVWFRAGHADARTVALARDEVVVDARVAVATVNTSDYKHAQTAVDNWLDVTTGALRSQYAQSKATVVKLLGQAKVVTSVTVLDAAVSQLDTTKGTATVLVSVNLKRQPTTGKASVTRNRLRASMKTVGGEWKLADLHIVSAAVS